MEYKHIKLPGNGELIQAAVDGALLVPENPIIGVITGDGVGVDITPVMRQVVDAAVAKAYANKRSIAWLELYAGQIANQVYGENEWLPAETVAAIQQCKVAIKGPLMTPIGGGIRSINVALRQQLDLYVCLRPVRYYAGTPSPVRYPELTDMVIFRENSEDIYAGIEWPADSQESQKLIKFLQTEMQVNKIRFPEHCGIGIKPVSKEGTERLIRKALQYVLDNNRKSLTVVHKGNIMKFTEGAFKSWAYDIACNEFNATVLQSNADCLQIIHPHTQQKIIIQHVIADAFLQQILLQPQAYDVIATLNLNGDYISDALAAQVGGIGIAPGANLSDSCAVFEATHGTAPNLAGKDMANPGSLILSAEMMLRHLGWIEAADLIVMTVEKTIKNKTVTIDLHSLLKDSQLVSCSEFGQLLIKNLEKD